MFNPNELSRVDHANSRVSPDNKVNYDLAYSLKTKKFRVSPTMFDTMDLEKNGLTLYEQKTDKRLILAAEPNAQAVMHRGREGFKKGREFTSSRMRFMLNQYGFTDINDFQLKKLGEQDGKIFFEITSTEPKKFPDKDTPTPIDVIPEQETPNMPEPKQAADSEAPEVKTNDPFSIPGEDDQFLDDAGDAETPSEESSEEDDLDKLLG